MSFFEHRFGVRVKVLEFRRASGVQAKAIGFRLL